jgi:hypothetical protein
MSGRICRDTRTSAPTENSYIIIYTRVRLVLEIIVDLRTIDPTSTGT